MKSFTKKVFVFVFLAALCLGWSSSVSAQCVPSAGIDFINCYRTVVSESSTGYVASDVVRVLESIGGFFLIISAIVSGIVIVVSGLMYMTAGNNSGRVATAKAVFKNGIIGALILFASGVIINTIALLALQPLSFFS